MSETTETTTPNPEADQAEVSSLQPEVSQDGEGATPGTTEAKTPEAPEPPQPSQQPDWRDKRIATLTRRLRELQERQVSPPEGEAPRAPPQPQIDQSIIDQRARELSAIQDFNRRCDETALAGRAQYGETEFNSRIANLQKLSDSSDPASVQAYNSMLMAALEAGDADRLLYELGADLNEAQRILGLNPTRMAVEMTRRASKPAIQVSSTPKPITPIGVRTASHEPINPDDPDRADRLSTAEWMRRREKQLADRRQ